MYNQSKNQSFKLRLAREREKGNNYGEKREREHGGRETIQ